MPLNLGRAPKPPAVIGEPQWDEHGFWKWSCGCLQFQDGYDLCAFHSYYGYTALRRQTASNPS